MAAILDSVLPVFALILVGALAARTGLMGRDATTSLNGFVVWLALPALLFQVMATVHASDLAHGGFALAFGLGMTTTFLLGFGLDRRPGRLADKSLEALGASYANTGFLGIPLGLALFGPPLLPALVLATLLTACGLFALVIGLIEFDLHGGGGLRGTVGKLARSLAFNPLVFSPALGALYAATGFDLPSPVMRFTTLLGAAASPCALVTIGLFLAQSDPSRDSQATLRLVILKLVVQPLVTAALAFAVFSMPIAWAKAAVLMSALPTGTGPFMLAKRYERDAALTSRVILITTVVSVVTVSALVAWIGPV